MKPQTTTLNDPQQCARARQKLRPANRRRTCTYVQLYVSMQQKMRHANEIAIHTTTYKSAAGAKAPPPHLHVPASQLPMRILLFLALATHVPEIPGRREGNRNGQVESQNMWFVRCSTGKGAEKTEQ